MRLARFFICLLVTNVSACGPTTHSAEIKNIFGQDSRTKLDSTQAPWKSIGLLDSGCTGTLVGKRLVLTAAHCVVDEQSGAVNALTTYFRPGFQGATSSERFWIGYMYFGTNQPAENRGQDWAVLLLEKDAADTYGIMSVDQMEFAQHLPTTVSIAGYSEDYKGKLSIHQECYVHEVSGDRLLNDCDSRSGVSGGPMIAAINGRKSIVGIAVSEYRHGNPDSVVRDTYDRDYANVAIGSSGFIETITELRKGLELGLPWNLPAGVMQAINPNTRPVDVPNGPGPGEEPSGRQLASATQIFMDSQNIETMAKQLASEFQWIAIKANQTNILNLQSAMQKQVQRADSLTNLMSDFRLGFRQSQDVMTKLPVILRDLKKGREGLAQFLTRPEATPFYRASSVHIKNADILMSRIDHKVYQ